MTRLHCVARIITGAVAGCALAQCSPMTREFQDAYHTCRQVQPGMTLAEVKQRCSIMRRYARIDVDAALGAVSTRQTAAGPVTRYLYRYDPPYIIADVSIYVDARGVVTSVQE
ncbi:MAG TPA: hypothetical protein VMA53_17120 [Stellaceae bacterium]|nr:hypothetical protein [Stellaceae bacterium]